MAHVAVKVESLSKQFKLPHERNTSLKQAALNFHRRSFEMLQALEDISFEVKQGEFFGIVGRNGSGKSTLLKILAGVYRPTTGSVTVDGRLTPFIELGVGFNMELTGRDNIFLNGVLLGLSRKEVEQKFDEIVAFAELEKFIDQKLKNYSSGMQVRLAFSIAIQAHRDVLLLDEVLAVGDAAFQRKCFAIFNDIKKQGRTVILVTHDMSAVQQYCDRAMMIEDSRVITMGDPREVALRYEVANSKANTAAGEQSTRPENPVVRLDDVRLISTGDTESGVGIKDDIEVEIDYTVHKPTEVQFNLFLVKPDGKYLAGVNTTTSLKNFKPGKGSHSLRCRIKKGQLDEGRYRLNVALYTYCEWPSSESPLLIDILDTGYGTDTPVLWVNEKSNNSNGEFIMQVDWDAGKA